jgi:hypothetical protein
MQNGPDGKGSRVFAIYDSDIKGLFGVLDGIKDFTRSFSMVQIIRFIYEKSFFGFLKSSGFL